MWFKSSKMRIYNRNKNGFFGAFEFRGTRGIGAVRVRDLLGFGRQANALGDKE
jgi:hypothetical protein